MLKGRKILIGITGSIAAYKMPLLVRLLVKDGAEVRIVMTPFSREFVTPLTLSTLSGNEVYGDFFDKETGHWHSHVELGLWADLFLIAPASANTIAKMRMGVADNYLLTVYLSARCPVLFAPAMDLDMYKHSATQDNIKELVSRGHHLIAPATGELASGLCGEGRMEEPEKIHTVIRDFFVRKSRFSKKKVLVTSGPTYESIDPVRYIGNHSTGLMGIEIARAFAHEGAEVTLILGPTHLVVDFPGVQVIPVVSAEEMFQYCMSVYPDSDIAVMAAAVADYKPSEVSPVKIKKKSENLVLRLEPTIDILYEMGNTKRKNQILVGFALETDNETEHAFDKLKRKKLDLIVMNSLRDAGAGFGHLTNKVSFISSSGDTLKGELKSKKEVSEDLLDFIYTKLLKTDVTST